ncbi:MAG TPA: ABC transporter permease [Thermomicrobiales bacterium]|nr:ABC transporter permease [Thermomicrobiales bacterium]
MSAAIPQQQRTVWGLSTIGSAYSRFRVAQAALGGRFKFSVALLLAIVAFGFLGPYIFDKQDPKKIVGLLYDPPSSNAWLGTDNFGRDVFTQLMHGIRTSLIIGVIAGAVATGIGVTIGTIAGFLGGLVEEILMGITNIVLTIPSIVVLILLSIAVGSRSITTMALIIGITSWPWTARAIRAQSSSLRNREHVDVARMCGAGSLSLIAWEIIPFMLSYVFLAFVLQTASGILQEAALSLLGLGPGGNTISLGIMLYWSLLWESVRTGAWWAFVPPTIFLTAIAFALLLLQSSLDEVFNPRLRRR